MTSPFSGSELRQEAIVSDIFPEYTNNRDKYDWTLPSLFVIIECHGIQHYQVQTFGKEASEAVMDFQSQNFRDAKKKEIALLNGWTYIEIPYTDEKEITSEYLINMFDANYNSDPIVKKTRPAKPEKSDKQKAIEEKQKEQARDYRRAQYQKNKLLLKSRKTKSS